MAISDAYCVMKWKKLVMDFFLPFMAYVNSNFRNLYAVIFATRFGGVIRLFSIFLEKWIFFLPFMAYVNLNFRNLYAVIFVSGPHFFVSGNFDF